MMSLAWTVSVDCHYQRLNVHPPCRCVPLYLVLLLAFPLANLLREFVRDFFDCYLSRSFRYSTISVVILRFMLIYANEKHAVKSIVHNATASFHSQAEVCLLSQIYILCLSN